MTNAARVRRWRVTYRSALDGFAPRPLTEADWAEQKAASTAKMKVMDAAIEEGRGVYVRVNAEMLRAGPLRTDEWIPAPTMAGIGRRLGRLSAAELEADVPLGSG